MFQKREFDGETVWLVYADDYGGTFSPYWLKAVYPENQEQAARDLADRLGLATVVRAENCGYDLSAYKQTFGGKYDD